MVGARLLARVSPPVVGDARLVHDRLPTDGQTYVADARVLPYRSRTVTDRVRPMTDRGPWAVGRGSLAVGRGAVGGGPRAVSRGKQWNSMEINGCQ